MSVHKHKNGRTYTYKFSLPGVAKPFRGPTGEETKRRALLVEARIRAEAVASQAGQPLTRHNRLPGMTLAQAAERFWEEKAQFEANGPNVETQLNRLLDALGETTLLHHITTDELTRYQSERRKDGVGNRTINAEVPELVSRLFRRAGKLWRVDVGDPIEWSSLKLDVPMHRTRTATRLEEVKLLRALRRDYRPMIRFALLTGLRRTALLIKRDQIDLDAMVLEYDKKSKRTGNKGWLPITPAMATLLEREMAKSDSEWVFTYVCQRTREGRVRGQRYPVTYSGMQIVMQRAVKDAGLKDWRLFHDLRHTAATRVLRKSQNLVAVQHMLGHSDIGQTTRYAHVLMDDVRKAMEKA